MILQCSTTANCVVPVWVGPHRSHWGGMKFHFDLPEGIRCETLGILDPAVCLKHPPHTPMFPQAHVRSDSHRFWRNQADASEVIRCANAQTHLPCVRSRPHSSLNSNKERAAGREAGVGGLQGSRERGAQILTSNPSLPALPFLMFRASMGALFLHNTTALYACLGAAAWRHDRNRSARCSGKPQRKRRETCPSPMFTLYDLTSDPRREAVEKALSAHCRARIGTSEPELIKPSQGWFLLEQECGNITTVLTWLVWF